MIPTSSVTTTRTKSRKKKKTSGQASMRRKIKICEMWRLLSENVIMDGEGAGVLVFLIDFIQDF